jgi:RNA polymerase sigma-70 factor (ECF subfamily)
MTVESDEALAAGALQGDLQSFEALVLRHREAVTAAAYRMLGDIHLAEDAAQEAFLRAWQRMHTYNPQYSFRNWVTGIAVNYALDQLRRRRESVSIDELPLRDPAASLEGQVEEGERAQLVRQAVLDLPPASRAVLVLREYQGLSYAEIADLLDIPVGTVMSRLNYARSQLRQRLAQVLEV